MGLFRSESNKCDTWDKPLDDRDDTCTTMFTNFCMSAIGVYMAKTTCIHKYQPSRSPEWFANMT